ncbi:hypothetical protein RJT34_26467 [Clitoria ternatea]|uniref:Uncharacterized protein n=1 Tax=Clitoria ternatea TaxID=43366 RepID=A0AAN9F8Y2_CLITE
MKKTINTLLPYLFLLFALTTNLKCVSALDLGDTEGNWLYNGVNYYILPSTFRGEDAGSGLTFARIGASDSLAVVQPATNGWNGSAVTISNPGGTKIIITGSPVDFKFADQSSKWVVVFDESAKVWYLSANGAKPGQKTKTGTFQISQLNLGFKFSFCNPSFCEDVGSFVDADKHNRLALGGSPFSFKFQNAHNN